MRKNGAHRFGRFAGVAMGDFRRGLNRVRAFAADMLEV